MNWIRVKINWLYWTRDDLSRNVKITKHLIPLQLHLKPVYLREDISIWFKENDIQFEYKYEPNYYDDYDNYDLDWIEKVLAIRFDDPEDRIYFIMRFV